MSTSQQQQPQAPQPLTDEQLADVAGGPVGYPTSLTAEELGEVAGGPIGCPTL